MLDISAFLNTEADLRVTRQRRYGGIEQSPTHNSGGRPVRRTRCRTETPRQGEQKTFQPRASSEAPRWSRKPATIPSALLVRYMSSVADALETDFQVLHVPGQPSPPDILVPSGSVAIAMDCRVGATSQQSARSFGPVGTKARRSEELYAPENLATYPDLFELTSIRFVFAKGYGSRLQTAGRRALQAVCERLSIQCSLLQSDNTGGVVSFPEYWAVFALLGMGKGADVLRLPVKPPSFPELAVAADRNDQLPDPVSLWSAPRHPEWGQRRSAVRTATMPLRAHSHMPMAQAA